MERFNLNPKMQKQAQPTKGSVRAKLDASGWQDAKNEDEKKTLESVRERLRRCLLAENIVCLIGCGVSRGVGGPSMDDLWNLAKTQEGFDHALKQSGYIVPKDEQGKEKGNVEEFLSRCRMAQEFGGTDSTMQKFLNAVELAILKRCRDFLRDDVAQLSAHRDFLLRLARRPGDKARVRIFTTNYDLCLERAAGLLGLPVIDGFSHTYPQRFDGRHYDMDWVRRVANQKEPSFVEGVFHLYKLHGSVDWKQSGGSLERDVNTNEAVMIYPRDSKFRLSYEQPFLEMMARFQFAVRQPNTALLALGFGFNDDHLSGPILSALTSNPQFSLVVATKASEAAAESTEPSKRNRFLNELSGWAGNDGVESVTLLDCAFDQFVPLIPNPAAKTEEQRFAELVQKMAKR